MTKDPWTDPEPRRASCSVACVRIAGPERLRVAPAALAAARTRAKRAHVAIRGGTPRIDVVEDSLTES